jgi:dTDP-4-dehydrorhamnose reductase
MRLLVFGRTGQVATELARLARPGAGLAVACLGREAADLADPEACAAAIAGAEADVVINAAAYTAVDRAEAEEALATRINAAAPGAMARAAAARDLPFLHLSTDYVFDGRPGPAWREADPPAPINAYGRSKLAGERAVLAAGGRAAVLRTSWVFSAHGANFVKTMLRLAATKPELAVVDDQRGGPTPAAAIAGALATVARHLSADGSGTGTFHFSGAPTASWHGFARAILDGAGLSVPLRSIPSAEFPTPARRPLNSALDCRRIASVHGLAQPDWREGLGAVLAELARSAR